MSSIYHRAVASVVITAALSVGSLSAAIAQTTAAPSGATSGQARKEHRAIKNIELAKLEDAGYNFVSNAPDYPADLEIAQKKAGLR